ncbi:MAG TPA: S-adenosylmethionine:tRNA ribosyltransferase-isomerase, partial [Acidobacteriota bacterium]|nr:S-adenosylmethionine:tRNA ribosyltransferase-isomerase [Acidobacteriota bacterium]
MQNNFGFDLPPDLVAKEPAERRGLNRDQVRLLVVDRKTHTVEHSRFDQLGTWLRSGDLLVLNSSRTIPAWLNGLDSSGSISFDVRIAEHFSDDCWLALIICRNREFQLQEGVRIYFGLGLSAIVSEQHPNIPRLWKICFSHHGSDLFDLLYRIGRPVRYEYVSNPWSLDDYQTIYATEPGSAEMPSAGRAFTWKMLLELKRCGVQIAFITLHTGLSSLMDEDLDLKHLFAEEEFQIGNHAAEQINAAQDNGNRIIAIGTTVVKTLESEADDDGYVNAGHGYTGLHISSDTRLRVVDGLL